MPSSSRRAQTSRQIHSHTPSRFVVNIAIQDSNHANSKRANRGVAPSVEILTPRAVVTRSVKLYCQLDFRRVEVERVLVNAILATKLAPQQLAPFYFRPEHDLGGRHAGGKLAPGGFRLRFVEMEGHLWVGLYLDCIVTALRGVCKRELRKCCTRPPPWPPLAKGGNASVS